MSIVRRRRVRVIVMVVIAASAIIALALTALRHNINVYYTPHELLAVKPVSTQLIRVGGWVMPKSLHRVLHSTRISFRITDHQQSIAVVFNGLLPSLFREGQGIVVMGHWQADDVLHATQVLAKHDANYHPPGVSASTSHRLPVGPHSSSSLTFKKSQVGHYAR